MSAFIEDERSALDRLPVLAPGGREREMARATGPDDVAPGGQKLTAARWPPVAQR